MLEGSLVGAPLQASQPPSSPTCCTKVPVKKRDALEFRCACVWRPTNTVYGLPQTHASLPHSTPNMPGTMSHDQKMLQEAFGLQGGTPLGSSRGVTACPTDVTPAHSQRCMSDWLCAVQAQQAWLLPGCCSLALKHNVQPVSLTVWHCCNPRFCRTLHPKPLTLKVATAQCCLSSSSTATAPWPGNQNDTAACCDHRHNCLCVMQTKGIVYLVAASG